MSNNIIDFLKFKQTLSESDDEKYKRIKKELHTLYLTRDELFVFLHESLNYIPMAASLVSDEEQLSYGFDSVSYFRSDMQMQSNLIGKVFDIYKEAQPYREYAVNLNYYEMYQAMITFEGSSFDIDTAKPESRHSKISYYLFARFRDAVLSIEDKFNTNPKTKNTCIKNKPYSMYESYISTYVLKNKSVLGIPSICIDKDSSKDSFLIYVPNTIKGCHLHGEYVIDIPAEENTNDADIKRFLMSTLNLTTHELAVINKDIYNTEIEYSLTEKTFLKSRIKHTLKQVSDKSLLFANTDTLDLLLKLASVL